MRTSLTHKIRLLEASIKAWNFKLAAELPTDFGLGLTDCPLCQVYVNGSGTSCEGCPVADETGHILCGDTPYTEADQAWRLWHSAPHDERLRKGFRACAKAEIRFLEKLKLGLETERLLKRGGGARAS